MTGIFAMGDNDRGAPRHALLDAPRQTPFEWARQRRADRERRRVDQAHSRAAHRLTRLGPDWRVVDWQRLDTKDPSRESRMSFLAIGPGGIFSVTIRPQGRSRVLMAGDVVQIDGRRPPYVAQARRNATRAAEALSRAAGTQIPVIPVLAFDGTGVISVNGLPKGCVVTTYGELPHVLAAHGIRLAPGTVDKLYHVASRPNTWINPRYESRAEQYRWFEPGSSVADKRAAGR